MLNKLLKKHKTNLYFYLTFSLLFIFFMFASIYFHIPLFGFTFSYHGVLFTQLGLLRFFSTTAIAFSTILSTMLIQTLIRNKMGEAGILGISSANFIIYAFVFLVNEPLFNKIFESLNSGWWGAVGIIMYFISSFLIGFFIITLSKNLNSKFIIIIGILMNVILSMITMILLKNLNASSNSFDEIYSKMMGSFTSINMTPFMFGIIIFANIISLIGIVLYRILYLRIQKSLLCSKYGKSMNGNSFVTRIILIATISLYSAISFYLGGIISFFGIGILMLTRQFFGKNEKTLILPAIFIGLISILFVDFIEKNFLHNIFGSVPEGVYLTLIGIPIILLEILYKGGK